VPSSQRAQRGADARPGRFRRISAIAAVLVVLAVILAACSGGDSSSNSEKKGSSDSNASASTTGGGTTADDATAQNASTEPVGAQAAIADYVKGQGHEYAGDCADAQLPRDEGKWCSTLKSSDPAAGTETYDVGPVGENPQKTVTVKRRGAAQLTPGYQVGVTQGNVGAPHQLARSELESDAFITGNLILDQQAGIGAGLGDLPAGAPTPAPGGGGTGGNGGTGGGGGGGTPPVVAPGGGNAQYPPNGEIVVENPTVEVGGEVAFQGSGCLPNELLQVLFDGHPIGTISSDADGRFAGSIKIPAGTAPGSHLLTVRGSACEFNTTINVAGNLAFTGSSDNTGTYVLAGIAAVVVGFVLVVGSRRRRHGIVGRRHASGP
jgi:LPXTG-motif cell wall-anchored protein